MKKIKQLGILLLSATLFLSACGTLAQTVSGEPYEATTFAMNTVMTFSIYAEKGEELIIDAEQEIRRLENLFSVTLEDSEISKINANAGGEGVLISADTEEILQDAVKMSELTDGVFDIGVYPLVREWGFTLEGEQHVPTQEEIDAQLANIDIDKLAVDTNNHTATLEQEGMAIDLGGIAKGYATDKIVELFQKNGVESGFFSLGGNVYLIGHKENGDKWKTALANPLNTNSYVGMITGTDTSIITSGGYQRYFEENGRKYHHIIDPSTGYPAESGLISVTIICESGAKGDCLSTALFIMGLEKSLELWRESDDFEAIFITEDGRLIATEGIATDFEFDESESDFNYEVVNRTIEN